MTDPSSGQAKGIARSGEPVDPAAPVNEHLATDEISATDEITATGEQNEVAVVDDISVRDDLAVVDDLARERIFGLDMVNAESLVPVVEEILDGPRRDDTIKPVVLTPNVDILVHLEEDPRSVEADLFRRAQYCLPDGQPLVIASRLMGQPLEARLPGSGLFAALWPRVVDDKIPVLVVAYPTS